MSGYKYNTKYSGLPAEEIIRIMREKTREANKKRREEMTEEEKKKIRETYKDKNVGECEICGGAYRNIYQHRNTKKHKKMMEEK